MLEKIVNAFIEKGILFLLVFTTLAFGAVTPWPVAVMEITALSLFFLHLIQNILDMPTPVPGRKTAWRHAIFYGKGFSGDGSGRVAVLALLSGILTLLVLLQMQPLPQALLKAISPAALATYREFGNYPADAWHPVSLNPDATRQELFRMLSYAAVFFVIAGRCRTRQQIDCLLKTVLFTGLFLVLFAVVQKMTWNGRIYWLFPVDPTLISQRIWGPYVNRNHFAGYMEMAIPLGIGLLLHRILQVPIRPGAPMRVWAERFLTDDRLLTHTLFYLLVLTLTAALFMTFSRGGILAAVCSSCFFAVITFRRPSLKIGSRILGMMTAVIGLTVVIASCERLEDRFMTLEADHVSRLNICRDAFRLICDHPLLGTGAGTFKNAYMRYQTHSPQSLYDHAHNDYVEIITDTGLTGFLLHAAMAVFFFGTACHRWRRCHGMYRKCIGAGGLASCVAISVHSAMDFNLHIPANALLLSVIAAITWAALFNIPDRKGDQPCQPKQF